MKRGREESADHRQKVGALVISLDFELHWGVRSKYGTESPYRSNLLGARAVIPRLLLLFRHFGIRATWATVGMLFARNREELVANYPSLRARYTDASLSPYDESVGAGELEDPIHYAPTLIEAIRQAPGQEIATHTFSHFYCLAKGQTASDFSLDIETAVRIAEERHIRLRSIVFPRNQCNVEYFNILRKWGIVAYRGNATGWMYAAHHGVARTWCVRVARLADTYIPLSGSGVLPWPTIDKYGLCNVAASCFMRPYSPTMRRFETIRLKRMKKSLTEAAVDGKVWHLWWHPHNFGANQQENLAVLEEVLIAFQQLRNRYGMQSLAMVDVADIVSGGPTRMRGPGES